VLAHTLYSLSTAANIENNILSFFGEQISPRMPRGKRWGSGGCGTGEH